MKEGMRERDKENNSKRARRGGNAKVEERKRQKQGESRRNRRNRKGRKEINFQIKENVQNKIF